MLLVSLYWLTRLVKEYPFLIVTVYVEKVWKQFGKITLLPNVPSPFYYGRCKHYNFWCVSLQTYLLSRAIRLSLGHSLVASGASVSGLIPSWPLISCVTLGKLLNLSVLQFPYLCIGEYRVPLSLGCCEDWECVCVYTYNIYTHSICIHKWKFIYTYILMYVCMYVYIYTLIYTHSICNVPSGDGYLGVTASYF